MTNIRRSRGYNYEYLLVKELNEDGWISRRLGGSSTGLPDIVAVFNDGFEDSELFSIEAKYTATSDYLYVPNDEYARCGLILNMFDLYKNKNIVLAFKFGADLTKKPRLDKKGKELPKRAKNEVKEYYFKIASDMNITNLSSIRCTIDGELFPIAFNPHSDDQPTLLYYKYKTIDDLKNNKNYI